jgi:RNA polymerase sigma-70 factor, ECF subfamily
MSAQNTDALRTFYVESRQLLYTYAVSITRNRESAEDAIHGVFLQLLRQPQLPAELRPYVFRCVRNATLDILRRTKTQNDSIFDESIAATPSGALDRPALRTNEAEYFLQQLSSDERETIVLKIYGEFTFQQISDMRQVPLPTVSSWYRRGLDKMKSLLTTDHQ